MALVGETVETCELRCDACGCVIGMMREHVPAEVYRVAAKRGWHVAGISSNTAEDRDLCPRCIAGADTPAN